MLDYRIHYAVLVNEDRLRAARQRAELKRIFRLGAGRHDGRR